MINYFLFTTLKLFSRLPFSILYILSDVINFINYRIIKYRKKIIRENIKKAFPTYTKSERKNIEKKYFKNFSDYLVETLKCFTISQNQLDKRLTLKNKEIFKTIKNKNQNTVMLLGHVFNWEWFIGVINSLATQENYAVYKPIKSSFWNDKINFIRQRFNATAVASTQVLKTMLKVNQNGNSLFFFVADQSPHKSKITYDLQFLNQETPVFIGFDKIIKKKNYAVVYCDVSKTKRGYYTIEFKQITPKNIHWQPYEVAQKFYKELEKTIQKNPDNWLWSHKRWKYKKGIDY